MNKVELFTAYQQREYVDTYIWESLFDYRLEQSGYDRSEKGNPTEDKLWLDTLHSMPHYYDWTLNSNDTVTITWGEGDDKQLTLPLSKLGIIDLDDEPELTLLWHSDYYDGPLSGMAIYNGEHVWFNCILDDEYGDRVYNLHSLKQPDEDELFRQHKLWQSLVGFHCDHDPDVYAEYDGGVDPNKYYKLQKKFPNVDKTSGEILATVHWYQFKNWGRPRK